MDTAGLEVHWVHFVATGGGGILATFALVWRIWIQPMHKREVEWEVWKKGVDDRFESGEESFQRHTKVDDEIKAELKEIKAALHRLEKAFAGVAPALHREAKN